MKRIAIFVSGAGESAERIVKLFNEGNRVKTVVVVVDDSASSLKERLEGQDLELIHVPDDEWHEMNDELVGLMKDKEIKLIVLDGFTYPLSDEILETTNGEVLRVTSPQTAPRDVVAALEKDLRRPKEEPQEVPAADEPPTPEKEWAEALKIHFTPPKVPSNPPVVPISSQQERVRVVYDKDRNESQREHHESRPPMPSTWLIWSILVTVFCCFIPGIIAIIFSSQVSSKYFSGDYEGAKKSSRLAEIWIIVSFVIGVLAATLYIPFMLIG